MASIAAHFVGIAAIVIASILIPGVLPKPHAAGLEWDPTVGMVKLADIPLPAPPPTNRPLPPSADTASTPVEAPIGIAPEEPAREPPRLEPGLVTGMADATGSIEPPPPPPPPEKPQTPIRLHSGIEPPRKLIDVAPVYPTLARTAGAQGVVIIEATIDTTGRVVAARVLRSVPLLDETALTAVRQWTYTPARMNGEAVPVLITVTVNFTLAPR
jgi:protein TonB